MQQRRRGRVKHIANVVVGGDFGDAEQAGAIGAAMPFLELPLMRQQFSMRLSRARGNGSESEMQQVS